MKQQKNIVKIKSDKYGHTLCISQNNGDQWSAIDVSVDMLRVIADEINVFLNKSYPYLQ